MSYSVYIKKDYKPIVRWVPDVPWYRRRRVWLIAVSGIVPACLLHTIIASTDPFPESPVSGQLEETIVNRISSTPDGITSTIVEENMEELVPSSSIVATDETEDAEHGEWKNVKIARGENLSLIFDRLGIAPTVLHKVLNSGSEAAALKHLMPDQELHFLFNRNEVVGLDYDLDITRTLQIKREGGKFVSSIKSTPLTTIVKQADAVIDSSLFLAGQDAGLTDNLIMQLVAIYGWDIDFALDIRTGDQFKVIYEEHYKDNVKVGEGPILAAEFTNRGKPFRAVRYTDNNGNTDYFSETGASMRKAFLRTPLNFTRISSRFNLRRKHPILNTIRAHKGVDYSAPGGTPIKAAGDGTITYKGRKGGYGKTVILKHGGNYSTLYAHMSRYARGIKYGSRVKQGQTIGYVGMSGLATGPHLHYEFRVNGVHRNPLTVKLPKADSIPDKQMAEFKSKTGNLLAQLEEQFDNRKKIVVALREEDLSEPASPIPDNY